MISDWKTYTLDEIADIQGGGTPSRQQPAYFGGDIPWVTPSDLPSIGRIGVLEETKESLTDAGLSKSSAKLIPSQSVLFSSRATIGKIAINNRECATNQGFANFTPKPNLIDSWFLSFLLSRYTPEIKQLAGKTTFLEVPRKRLRAFRVQVPNLEEQRRIVARIKECMARVDEIEALRGETLQEYVALQTALLGAVIEPKEWPSMKIGNLVTTTRNGRSISTSNEGATGFVLGLSAVREVNLNPTAKKPIVLPPNILEKYQVRDGDVFVSRSNTQELVGLASVATENVDDCIYPDLLIKLSPNTEIILPRFLAYALRIPSARAQIRVRASGTSQSMVKISGARLKDVEIPVPPLEAQVRLIERLDLVHDRASDLLVDLKAPEIAQLRESILRKAFAGEL